MSTPGIGTITVITGTIIEKLKNQMGQKTQRIFPLSLLKLMKYYCI